MKRVGLVLFSMLVGGVLVLGLQELSIRLHPSYQRFSQVKKALGASYASNMSSDGFFAISSMDGSDENYQIVPKNRLFPNVNIRNVNAVNSSNLYVRIQGSGSITLLQDNDFDGAWDRKTFLVDGVYYVYGKETGFPLFIRTQSNTLVRVDGDYYELHEQGDRCFILQDGGKLEIDSSDWEHPKPARSLMEMEESEENDGAEEDLQQYQMNTIRSGMPPLPIPLTQEMDDQLVKEGILPPKGK